MKTYLQKPIELYHDLKLYNIELTELTICAKALDVLPDSYTHIKTAARASQVTTIPRSTKREGTASLRTGTQQEIKDLNTELKSLKTQMRKFKKLKFCTRCNRTTHSNDECWLLHPELKKIIKRQSKPRWPVTHTATIDQNKTQDETFKFTGYHTTIMMEISENDYLIDSGANASITKQQEHPPRLQRTGDTDPSHQQQRRTLASLRKRYANLELPTENRD